MQKLISDLRWGLRLLFKNPGFTVAALISLSLGIGVTTLVFTFASGVFLRTMSVPEPGRFVNVYAGRPTYAQYLALRDQVREQVDLVASRGGFSTFTTDTDSVSARILTVSDNYFEVLGMRPAAGRLTNADRDQAMPDSCVISYHLWASHFGGSREAIGKVIRLGELNLTITAIGPRDFRGTELRPVDIWLPAVSSVRDSEKVVWELSGRLRPGASASHVRSVLEQGYQELGIGASEVGPNRRVGVQSLAERYRLLYAPVTFFTGLGFLVLLVGCANVTGLLSTRSIERRTEIAVRLALGSGRGCLIRMLLTESALLAGLAGFIALLVTWGLVMTVKPWLPNDLLGVSFAEVTVNTRVLAATVMFACLATLAAGLLPAWRASRTDLVSAMKGNSVVGGALNPRASMRKTLVVLQLAVSFAFVCIGILFMRSMSLTEVSDLQSDRLVVANLSNLIGAQSRLEPRMFHRLVVDRLEVVPGVENVTMVSSPPLFSYQTTAVRVAEGTSSAMIGGAVLISSLASYFEATGTPLLRGRTFSDHPEGQTGAEVVVSEAMARRFWPGRDPVGRSVILGDENAPACVVVGIAKDVRAGDASLYERPAQPVVYVPAYSGVGDESALAFALIKTRGSAALLLHDIRSALLDLPGSVRRPECETLETQLWKHYRPQQFGALFALILGLLAGTLAAFGLYSVTSSTIAARTREIGIRAALGATRGQTVGLFLRQGIRLSVLGIVLGIPVAWGAALVLRSGMFGIVRVDVSTLAVSAVAVACSTMVACYLPARRAARIDPMAALRTE